ncbi:MAG: carboxypeptidase-like regulatory domain-containing protein [Flectobacillus sp.]|uniref:carboxypeptidase-like regulatory domain-containing protein n=1 Tax=Flectobacillus sp. TaxID=50419 RepID=UPI003B9D9C03
MKNLLLLFIFLCGANAAFSQKILTGRILDGDNQQPIQGVNVTVKGGTERATISDVKGKFSLRTETTNTLLIIEIEDYEPLKIKLNTNSQNLTILLTSSNEDSNGLRSVGFNNSKMLPKHQNLPVFYAKVIDK